MPPNILTSHRGRTLAIRLTGPLDRRLASGLFSRFLSAQSGYDELVVDLTGIDEVHDTGLAARADATWRLHEGKLLHEA